MPWQRKFVICIQWWAFAKKAIEIARERERERERESERELETYRRGRKNTFNVWA